MPSCSVVIPAYNEEILISKTISAIQDSANSEQLEIEIIVVDHSSTDNTKQESAAASRILTLARGGSIGAVRNYGARHSSGEIIIFVDADTVVTTEFIPTVIAEIANGAVGGAVRGLYFPKRKIIRIYAKFWDWYASRSKRPMTQGVCQYCTREAFSSIGGYDESMYFAEDTEFYWRLTDFAARHNGSLRIPGSLYVYPSSRRMDNWPVWKVILWTNPWTCMLGRKSYKFWKRWYGVHTVR